MSNPIPPFVCSTPPPIDCIVDAPPPVDDDFGDFAAVDDQFEASSLPVTPVHVAKLPDNASAVIPSSIPPSPERELNHRPEDDDIVADATVVVIKPIEQDNSSYTPVSSKIDLKSELPYIIEANSPPPLDFAPDDDDLTPCDDLDNDDDDDEVDEFPIDDAGKYDDNISLPSLKFDSLSNVSKSTTPVSDELTKSNHEDSDSISAFVAMPSGSLDEEPTVLEECTNQSTEKTAAGEDEVKEIPFEALTISEVPADSNDHVTVSLSRKSINENDDDFTEFEAFPPAPLQNDLESEFPEPPKEDFAAEETQGTGDFAFEADFSQFSSFEPIAAVQPPAVISQITDNNQLTEKSSLDDLDADDFDDFQDFAVAAAAPVSATPVVKQRKASIEEATPHDTLAINSNDKEEEDDDFGEFSEVIESETTSIPSSNSGFNLSNLNDKLKPILEMMFPLANAMEEDQANHLKQLTTTSTTTTTTTTIDQIDTAKALEYQWNNSEMRHSLIKSLGVDSRNILYGEKWNSSMPRYAANLSFNPLEPMKSDKAAASSSSSTSSTTDYRKRSENLTTTSLKGDVPAVEFDWNSSGLVNPLDGVKEILHERTIEAIHTPQLGEPHPPIDQQSNSALTSNNNVYDSNKPPPHGRFIDEETISAPIEFKSYADASAAISTATATAPAAAATPVIAATTTPTALSDDYINITSGDYQHHNHQHHSSVLETNIDSVLATTQASLNHSPHAAKYQESSKTDLETELQHSVVVTTSTYAGPLKETHIFTPSKSESILARSTASKTPRTSESSKCPIDFDYEIAAAGIIIDETVVKKEYRDVEYNPGFGLKYREEIENNHSTPPDIDTFSSSYHSRAPKPPSEVVNDFNDFVSVVSEVSAKKASVPKSNSFDDEFSDFQSVPAPVPIPPTIVPSAINPSSVLVESKTSPSHLRKLRESERSSSNSRTGTPVSLSDEMILSPAILLPQAIQIESKPTIEWPEPGINAEELARIEELFPQPKVGSNKPSPSHSGRSQPTPQPNRAAPDDDDWSEFVSVPASATSNHIQSISQQFQKQHASPAKSAAAAAADANDEEWSDFVSSAPPPANQQRQAVLPQFNSASWQNANFYNNPMSAYASPPTSFYYQPPQQQLNSNNLVPNLSSFNNNTAAATNNNNTINNNNSINQYLINNQSHQQQQQHLHHQQHIQMMRDFSNSSPMDGGSIAASSIHQQFAAAGYGFKNNRGGITMPHHGKSSQFGGASSKVAPSISLIPDLGFVAPTHTSFISVPKSSLITKK